jgi:hypothetical protein
MYEVKHLVIINMESDIIDNVLASFSMHSSDAENKKKK